MVENFEQDQKQQQTESESKYFSKIEKIEEEYKGKRIFPMGEIMEVSWADLGKTLSIQLGGDLTTGFEPVYINIVHPDSERGGWIGKGHIGFTLGGDGVDISRIPLPEETISMIKNIYQEYTGKSADLLFDTHWGSDAAKFADPNLYKNIVSKKR